MIAASQRPARPDAVVAEGETTVRFVTGQYPQLADPFGPETILVAEHSGLGVAAIIVVHNTARGQAMGGLRMVPDIRVEEVSDLACAMTFKNALAGRIKARFVLESANKPLSLAAGEHLHARGVLCSVDYLTNSGGIIACAEEIDEVANPLGPLRLPRAVARIVSTVRTNAEAVYALSRKDGMTPRAAAERVVIPRTAAL